MLVDQAFSIPKTGRLMHHKRDVSTCRPMHITQKVVAGLPSLRQGWIRDRLIELLRQAVPRGLRTGAVVVAAE